MESKEEEKRMLRARRFEKRRCAILRDEADVGSGDGMKKRWKML